MSEQREELLVEFDALAARFAQYAKTYAQLANKPDGKLNETMRGKSYAMSDAADEMDRLIAKLRTP